LFHEEDKIARAADRSIVKESYVGRNLKNKVFLIGIAAILLSLIAVAIPVAAQESPIWYWKDYAPTRTFTHYWNGTLLRTESGIQFWELYSELKMMPGGSMTGGGVEWVKMTIEWNPLAQNVKVSALDHHGEYLTFTGWEGFIMVNSAYHFNVSGVGHGWYRSNGTLYFLAAIIGWFAGDYHPDNIARPWVSGNSSATERATLKYGSARTLKEDALLELKAAKLLTANKHALKEIDNAIDHIQKSLASSLWVDDSHLSPKLGHRVFDEERQAVERLMEILRDSKEKQPVKDQVLAVINELMKADELLARNAIDDAKALGSTDPRVVHEIAEADKEVAKAVKGVGEKHYNKTVQHFCKAWKHAQNAIKKAN
jgi:hypothetical protein